MIFIQSLGLPSFLTNGSRAIVRIIKIEPMKMILMYSPAKARAVPLAPRMLIEVSQKISPATVITAPVRRQSEKALCTIYPGLP